MQTSFIDARMTGALCTGPFPLRCSIQAATDSTGAGGEPVRTWADVAGMTGIPCSVSLRTGRQVQGNELEYGVTTHRISLEGDYPAIGRLNRAVAGGVTYQVRYCSPAGLPGAVTVLECTIIAEGA
jgi:hypothetical protein